MKRPEFAGFAMSEWFFGIKKNLSFINQKKLMTQDLMKKDLNLSTLFNFAQKPNPTPNIQTEKYIIEIQCGPSMTS